MTLKKELEKEKVVSRNFQEEKPNSKECLKMEQLADKTIQETNNRMKLELESEKKTKTTLKKRKRRNWPAQNFKKQTPTCKNV